MKIVSIGNSALVSPRIVPRLIAGFLGLAAAAMLLGACTGGAKTQDQSFWHSMYGDPDTGHTPCCRHAGRDSNH